jgi:hypothetical protein
MIISQEAILALSGNIKIDKLIHIPVIKALYLIERVPDNLVDMELLASHQQPIL